MSPAPPRPPFICQRCGDSFSLPQSVSGKYPGWVPPLCPHCFKTQSPAAERSQVSLDSSSQGQPGPAEPGRQRSGPEPRPAPSDETIMAVTDPELASRLQEVLDRFHAGPAEGVFTDGGCRGNPGPGGWAAVRVQRGELLARRYGREARTTNNRMELSAIIAGYQMLGLEETVTLFSDSELCVRTLNEWAPRWARNKWRRKTGPVANVDLVRQAHELARSRPGARLVWIKAHAGSRWNEYVDVLATSFL